MVASLSKTKGKIVLVPFPFDDLSSSKVRPALVLTNPVGAHHHVVLAFISSQVPSAFNQTDLLLDVADAGFPATGLRVSSVIRLHRLLTVTTALFSRQLGELTPPLQNQVSEKLRRLFEL